MNAVYLIHYLVWSTERPQGDSSLVRDGSLVRKLWIGNTLGVVARGVGPTRATFNAIAFLFFFTD